MLRLPDGTPLRIGRRLAQGGQGEIFEVLQRPGLVFKRYKPEVLAADNTLPRRIAVMVANRPANWRESASGHVLLAWPASVVDDGGRCVGFLMPLIDLASTVELHRAANPSDRQTATGATAWLTGFSWRYLVGVGVNLAMATHAVHESGTVIGDFNERNVRVSRQTMVTLLDCDSMQLTDPTTGEHFLCGVGLKDFTPPELLNADWRKVVRRPSSDLYALAIHLHQLLLEGEHPFRGVWHGVGEKPPVAELARQGLWAYAGRRELEPRPVAIGIDLIPDEIAALFRRAFVNGATNPRSRPTAEEWRLALARLQSELTTCTANRRHTYRQGRGVCPLCAHEAASAPGRQAGGLTQSRLAPAPPFQPVGAPTYGRSSYGGGAGPYAPVAIGAVGTPPPRRKFPAAATIGATVLVALLAICGVAALDRDSTDSGAVSQPAGSAVAQQPSVATTTAAFSTPDGLVDYTNVVADGRASGVAQMFATYFGGINGRNWDTVLSVQDPSRTSDPTAVKDGYARTLSTTHDEAIVLTSLTDNADGSLTAGVTFTSTQDAGYGPSAAPDQACTRWDIPYLLSQPNPGDYRIASSRGAQPTPC